jgi:cytoskeletal protein CcmA (bactofilin family)
VSESGEPSSSSRAPTVLGAGASFDGVLAFRGTVHVEGQLRGDVIAQGSLKIEPQGRVEGRIEVDELVVAGVIEGDVYARRRVELLPTARVHGEVRTPALALAEGSVLDGRCHAGTALLPPPARRGDDSPAP